MKLIKLAIIAVGLAFGSLTASTNVLATPQPPRNLIIVVIDGDGYRNVWVCNSSGCVLQDRYWTGESQQLMH